MALRFCGHPWPAPHAVSDKRPYADEREAIVRSFPLASGRTNLRAFFTGGKADFVDGIATSEKREVRNFIEVASPPQEDTCQG